MELVFATHNLNKFKEVKALMPAGWELLNLDDIGCFDDIPETAKTIEGNAILKAEYVKKNYGYDCFADDTGLEVAALNGAPGVHSARYAGPENDAKMNMRKLLAEMKDISNREARFRTTIAFIRGDSLELFNGICNGTIMSEPAGESGFGYDPIFLPDGYSETFAEMSMTQKGEISHRALAIKKLISYLSKEQSSPFS